MRKTLRLKWYRSPIDPALLRQLMQRSDLKAWVQTLAVLAYMGVTAAVAGYLFSQQRWLGLAIALLAHGTFGCFLGAAGHKLDHGTVFKTWRGIERRPSTWRRFRRTPPRHGSLS